MSVIINARGTKHASFRVGDYGTIVWDDGRIESDTQDLTVNIPSGKAFKVNSGADRGTITTDRSVLSITAPYLKLNANLWPATDGMAGQVLQTNGSGSLSWVTPSSTAQPSFPTQAANSVLASPSGVVGIPTFRKLVTADIPLLNQNTTGNAGTATRLETARTITITGDLNWSVLFDGSSDVTGTVSLPASGVVPGIYTQVIVDNKGRVTAGYQPTTLSGYGILDAMTTNTSQTISGNKTFVDTAFFGNANRNQAGVSTVVSYASGNNSSYAAVPKDSIAARTGTYSIYGSFSSGGDYLPRRVSDMWGGFDGDAWGTEYIAWGVGVGASDSNETGARTDERLRLTRLGLICAGDISITSDERLKDNWADLPDDIISQIASVKVGTYTRVDTGARQVGVSAQSLEGVLPDAVYTSATGMKSVAYGNAALAMCVAMAQKIQELEAKLDALTK